MKFWSIAEIVSAILLVIDLVTGVGYSGLLAAMVIYARINQLKEFQ